MVSGTYVLTDTIKAAFTTVFTTSTSTPTRSSRARARSARQQRHQRRRVGPVVPRSRCSREVRALPGVAEASGSVSDDARISSATTARSSPAAGRPALALQLPAAGGQRFNPLTLTSGTGRSAPDEVDIDAATAGNEHFKVGADDRGRRPRRRSCASGSPGRSRSPASRRSAARRWRSSRSRPRRGSSTRGPPRRDRVAAPSGHLGHAARQ